MSAQVREPFHPNPQLPLAVAILPLITVHLCYLVSAWQGHVPVCIPYLEGCTSISATGRHGYSYVLFKIGMVSEAVLLLLLWSRYRRWLTALGDPKPMAMRAMWYSGALGAIFLTLYTAYLGSDGEFYRFMRRVGVMVYFGGSFLAQLVLLDRLQKLGKANLYVIPPGTLFPQLCLCCGLLVAGAASLPIMHLLDHADALENIVEWWFALLMVCYYLFTARAWRQTGSDPSK